MAWRKVRNTMKANTATSTRHKHDAEFLGRDREHEIGVAFGQDALDRALAGAASEPAALLEGFERLVDVEGVAGDGSRNRSMRRAT
jgi:hypothetical protein